MSRKITVKQLAMIGLMTALVVVASKIEIRLPSVLGVTRIHLGNGLCILSGFLMGPLAGGLAAGLGSFFFDLIFWGGNPAGWLVTFLSKFVMGAVSGILYKKLSKGRAKHTGAAVIAAAAGQLVYIIVYLLKEYTTYHWILGNPDSAVKLMLIEKLGASSINGVAAVILSVLLITILEPAFRKNGLSYE